MLLYLTHTFFCRTMNTSSTFFICLYVCLFVCLDFFTSRGSQAATARECIISRYSFFLFLPHSKWLWDQTLDSLLNHGSAGVTSHCLLHADKDYETSGETKSEYHEIWRWKPITATLSNEQWNCRYVMYILYSTYEEEHFLCKVCIMAYIVYTVVCQWAVDWQCQG